MDRRRVGGGIGCPGRARLSRFDSFGSRQPQGAPNIVLVQTDDQDLSQMRAEVMPNVTELLADQGTVFDRAYVTTPLSARPGRPS